VNRIGVRYVNKIIIPATGRFELDDYISGGPVTPPGMNLTAASFLNRAEYAYEDQQAKLLLTFAALGSEPPGEPAFLLDLDVIWEDAQPLELKAALEKAELLHELEGAAFEALITDKVRELFDAS
jgi:uncharacterized protein (TIGR04255 family)